MNVTIPYPPSVNRYWRRSAVGMYLSKEGRQFKEKVKQIVGDSHQPLTGPVQVLIHVFRPQKRGDLDNILKATLDSFNGLLYIDDSQIVKILAIRGDDKLNPRVEVTINALG